MRILIATALVSMVAWTSSVNADNLPAPIQNGFRVYADKGATAAVKIWMKNSPLERSGDLDKVAGMLNSVERMCGAYRDYQEVGINYLSSTVQFVYVQLNYASCPVFGRFIAYEGDAGWLVTQVNFNAKPEVVLPDSMLSK